MSRLTLLLVLLGACVQDLSPDPSADDANVVDPDDPDAPAPSRVTVVDEGDHHLLHVDATDNERWVHVDLALPDQVEGDAVWTLAFRRYHVAVNGGDFGEGAVQVVFDEVAFDEAGEAPAEGWQTDVLVDGVIEHAMADWYDYDAETHILTARPGTWFVRDGLGGTWALALDGYYSPAGDAGHPTLRVRGL